MLFSVNNNKTLIIISLIFLSFAFCKGQSAINSKIYFDFIRQKDGSNEFGIKRAYFTYKNKMSSDLSFILQTAEPADSQFWAADVNGDGSLDILDVVTLVDWILNN